MRATRSSFKIDNKAVEFGLIASPSEIASLNKKVKSLKSMVVGDEKILGTVKDFVKDFPKLTPYHKSRYKLAKTRNSRNKRELAEMEPLLNIAIASREALNRVPKLIEILLYAEKNDLEPSLAITQFRDKFIERLYPHHIELIARNLNRLERTFKNADEPHFDSSKSVKVKWLDRAVIEEDKTYPSGQNPMSIIAKLVKKVSEVEKNYIQDAIKDHIGQGTTQFNSKDIQNITKIKFQDIQPKQAFQGVVSLQQSETELGGFFSKFLKILSPAQIFGGSIFSVVLKNTVGSSIVRKNIPSGLYGALQGLSQASANIAVGKVSKDNLRKAIKYSIKVATESGELAGKTALKVSEAYTKAMYAGFYYGMETSAGKTIDKYTGGLVTSGMNLNQVQGDLARGKKIDVVARSLDAVKLGTVLVGGSIISSVAISSGTKVATEKTALGKTSLGKGIISAGAIYAGGGDLSTVAKKVATQQATAQVKKQVAPRLTKVLGKSATSLIIDSASSAVSSSTTGQSTFSDALTKSASKNITKEATKRVVTSVAGEKVGTIVSNVAGQTVGTSIGDKIAQSTGNTTASSGTESSVTILGPNGELMTKTRPSFLEKIGQSVKDEAKAQAISYADSKTGGKVSSVLKAKDMVMKYKDMTPEEFSKRVAQERVNLYKRIEEERENAQARIKHVEKQIEDASAEEAKKTLMNKIADEERRLNDKVTDMQDSFQKGIKKASEDYENFNTQDFLNKESNRIGQKIRAEKDRFTANMTDRLWKLSQKYGPQLLAYLMYKYGPQSDYDQFITEEDKNIYMNFVPPKDGTIYKKRPLGWGSKLALIAGALVATKMVMG
jgi:hypothetical protein